VLLLADGNKVTIGKPYVPGARVTATVKKNGKGDKVIVFKYKSKVRYRRKNGHRQLLTSLNIDRILPAGVEETKPAAKAPKKKAEAVKPVAKPAVETPPKAVETEKPAAKAPVKKPAAKPAAKTTAEKPASEKPAVKRTPRKKTEEKADGA
jgi:large subunit ribosomal protein L21